MVATATDTKRKDPCEGKGDRSTALAATTSRIDQEVTSDGNGAMAERSLEREVGRGLQMGRQHQPGRRYER